MHSIHIPWQDQPFSEPMDTEVFPEQGRVFKCLVNDEPAWVKKSESSKYHIAHHLQGMLYKIFKDPILIPTVLSKNENDIQFQVGKLRHLKQIGVHVPDIIDVQKDYFIMSDCGECVKDYLRKHPRCIMHVLSQACREMAKLHQKNCVHGGAQIKNFVIKKGVVSLIDFEEKVLPQYIEAFKIRDVLVFLLSIERNGFQFDIKRLCRLYGEITHKDIYGELKKFFKRYQWVFFLNHKFFDFLSMKDVRAFLNLMQRFHD